jgi:Spy/CpxP family protein refolding chaperone
MLKSMMVAGALGLVALMGEVGLAAAPDGTPAALPSWRQLADTPVGRIISGNLGRLLVLRSEMNVTPEQRAEVRGVLVSYRSQIAATVKSVREKHLVLRDAVLADQPDEDKIRAAASDLGDALGDAAVKAAKLRGELAPIMTDEQRELIRQFRQDRDESIDEFVKKAIKGE